MNSRDCAAALPCSRVTYRCSVGKRNRPQWKRTGPWAIVYLYIHTRLVCAQALCSAGLCTAVLTRCTMRSISPIDAMAIAAALESTGSVVSALTFTSLALPPTACREGAGVGGHGENETRRSAPQIRITVDGFSVMVWASPNATNRYKERTPLRARLRLRRRLRLPRLH
jgi:hypothetical protein